MTGLFSSPEIRHRLLHGGLWSAAIRAASIIVGVGTNALLARLLVPDEMGAYFLTISVLTAAYTIAQLGLPQTIVRVVAVSIGSGLRGRANQTIKRAVVLCLCSAGGIATLFYLLAGKWIAMHVLHSTGLYSVVGTVSLLIVVLSVQGVLAEVYRGLHDVRSALLFGTLIEPLMSATLFAGIWTIAGHSNLRDVLALSLGCALATLILTAVSLRPKLRSLQGAGSMPYRELLLLGWPLCVVQIATLFSRQGDLWMVGASLTEKDVAIYGALTKLVLLMSLTFSLIGGALQSTAAEMYAKGDKQQLQRIAQVMALGSCIPAAVLLVIYVFLGAEILELLFGAFYRDGYLPLLILGSFYFAGMLLGHAGILLIMTGHQKALMWWTISVGAVEFVLALVLVRHLGLIGVAAAWGAGAILYDVGTWVMGYRILGIKTHAAFPERWPAPGTRS